MSDAIFYRGCSESTSSKLKGNEIQLSEFGGNHFYQYAFSDRNPLAFVEHDLVVGAVAELRGERAFVRRHILDDPGRESPLHDHPPRHPR